MSDQLPKDMDAIRIEYLETELSAMTQRAEAAEALIEIANLQKPFRWMRTTEKDGFINEHLYTVRQRDDCGFGDFYPDQVALYTSPVIPPDIAELQRELAELTRKLAEQPEGFGTDAIYASWHGAGVDIAGGNWKRFIEMLAAAPQPGGSNE